MDHHPADQPLLSAIVISRNDEATIERAVEAVVHQEGADCFEVIVVSSGTDRTAEIVRKRFPHVTLVELEGNVLPGAARNAGLRCARGCYISFPGSHVVLSQGSLAARLTAHLQGHAMVTGTMLNGTCTWAGWASYFLDNRTVLPGRPSGVLDTAPVRCSYLRDALLEVGGFPEGMRTAEDTVVNERLFARGYRAYRSQEVVLFHRSKCDRPLRLLSHHFVRGRGIARALLSERASPGSRVWKLAQHQVGGVPVRVLLITVSVVRWGVGLRRHYLIALPLVLAGAASWWAGIWYELAVGRHTSPLSHASSLAISE